MISFQDFFPAERKSMERLESSVHEIGEDNVGWIRHGNIIEVYLKPNQDIGRATERTKHLRNLLPSTDIHSYLDIGSGSGEITEEVQREFLIPETYAADVFFPQTSIPENVNFLLIQDDQIPLPDNSIDLVTAYVSIHHFQNFNKMMYEILRVMKISGYLFIREHDARPESQPFLDLVHSVVEAADNNYHSEFIDNFYSSYYSREGLTQSLESFGFELTGYDMYPTPNPQRLYHALFRLNEKKKGNTPKKIMASGRTKFNVQNSNLIQYIRKSRDKRAFIKNVMKRFDVDWNQVQNLMYDCSSDREFFEELQGNLEMDVRKEDVKMGKRI